MPINAHPEYMNAEAEYHQASTPEQRLLALEKMMKFMPKHKGAETLRKNIRTRYKKLKQEFQKKSKKSKGKQGIKKEDLQAVIIGLTNSGKSSVLKTLTNAQPRIASYGFTTIKPEIGTLNYQGCNIQVIDLPPIASENFDKGIVNNADTILIVVEKIHEIKPILEQIKNKNTKKIIVFNKKDTYEKETIRKISETLKSKRYNFVLISCKTTEGIEELKEKIFKSFNVLRIYTKTQGKKQDNIPVIIQPNSTLKDVAEKILHGYSKKVKFAKISGPSAKFKDQKVGLSHLVKDKDVVEFITE
jgi:small GTP-binding protein